MKTSIDHLPELRQQQINEIVEVIKDFVDPEKIILYGSRASGTFTEDKYEKNGIQYSYISDYDIAIITSKTNLKEYEVENEVLKKVKVKPDINVLMYDLDYFNEKLEQGKYFFVTLFNDGILIFDNGQSELISPKPLSMAQVRSNALEDFDDWMPRIKLYHRFANDLLMKPDIQKSERNMATWLLYQTIEGAYSLILLVFTGEKPKLHNLYKYRNNVKGLSKELDTIFPFPTKDRYEYNLFDLLKRAYIGAKYKKEYEITILEVNEMNKRISKMIGITEEMCLKRIEFYDTSQQSLKSI
jgi:predicted nucleotidyltransferase